jgi:hypothetical protein
VSSWCIFLTCWYCLLGIWCVLMKLCVFQISAGEVTCEKEKKVGFACAEGNERCVILLLFSLSIFQD